MKALHHILKNTFICGLFATNVIAQPLVTYPNGGETIEVGDTINITWSGTALNTEVGIDYTIDNWANTIWLNTSYKNPAANSYKWIVPNTPGSQCKVGVFNTLFQGDISDNFFVIKAASTGIDEESKQRSVVTVYPNPSKGGINVHNPLNATLLFNIYDITGRRLKVNFIKDGLGNYSLDHQALNPGIYVMEIKDERGGKPLRKKIEVEN